MGLLAKLFGALSEGWSGGVEGGGSDHRHAFDENPHGDNTRYNEKTGMIEHAKECSYGCGAKQWAPVKQVERRGG